MSYLSISDLDFRYPASNVWQLRGFEMSADKERCTALVGPSGCAKTTVLRLIAGLEVPAKGTITLDGEVLTDGSLATPPERRRVGLVFQDYALFPHYSVIDNVAYGLRGGKRKARREQALEFLELVGMAEHRDKYPFQLSGGQQQRVALARALAPKPRLLLLDEPFSNLDAELRGQVRDDVRKVLSECSITSILVTHDVGDAQALAQTVIKL